MSMTGSFLGAGARRWRCEAPRSCVGALTGAALLACLSLVLAAEPAAARFTDTLSVRVLADGEGRSIEIEGGGFAPDSEVRLLLAPQRSAPPLEPAAVDLPLLLTTTRTDRDGTFSAQTVVPAQVPAGPYLIEARGNNADGTNELLARKVEVGSPAGTTPDDLGAVARWVGLTLLALAATVVVALTGRWLAGRLATR